MNHHSHTYTDRDPLVMRVLERIEKEHVQPRSKWAFWWSNVFFWILGACAVALGAAAFSGVLFDVENVDWKLFPATHSDFLSFFFASAPFLWVGSLALFTLLGYENIRRTKRGYRYPLSIIVLGTVLTSVSIGTALCALGWAGSFEAFLGDHPPFYRPVLVEERALWDHPEAGVLGGKVVAVANGLGSFTLQDFNGTVWTVDSDDLRDGDLAAVARGGDVHIIGVPVTASTTEFHACFVFSWQHYESWFDMPPPPLMGFASSSETNESVERSDECKGIRPYAAIHSIPR